MLFDKTIKITLFYYCPDTIDIPRIQFHLPFSIAFCDRLVSMSASYHRVLLKLSGEQLAGKYDSGIDPERATWLAKEIQPIVDEGHQVVIMIGGGNFLRGAQIAGHGIKRVTADHMGMLGTMINALALTDIFEDYGLKTRV